MPRKSIKIESLLGNKEYSPSKSFYPSSVDTQTNWAESYKKDLIMRMKVFKPKSVLPFFDGRYNFLVKLVDAQNVIWEWNEDNIEDTDTSSLRNIVVMLENALELSKR